MVELAAPAVAPSSGTPPLDGFHFVGLLTGAVGVVEVGEVVGIGAVCEDADWAVVCEPSAGIVVPASRARNSASALSNAESFCGSVVAPETVPETD